MKTPHRKIDWTPGRMWGPLWCMLLGRPWICEFADGTEWVVEPRGYVYVVAMPDGERTAFLFGPRVDKVEKVSQPPVRGPVHGQPEAVR